MALTRVRYRGLSDVRIIPADDPGLKARGIKVSQDMVWHRGNLFSIYIDNFSEAMEVLFRDEGAFDVEEIDAQSGKAVKEIVTATRADDTGNTVIDSSTGQKSVKGSGS